MQMVPKGSEIKKEKKKKIFEEGFEEIKWCHSRDQVKYKP